MGTAEDYAQLSPITNDTANVETLRLQAEAQGMLLRMGKRTSRYAQEARHLINAASQLAAVDAIVARAMFDAARSDYGRRIGSENQLYFLLGAFIGSFILLSMTVAIIMSARHTDSLVGASLVNLAPPAAVTTLVFYATVGSLVSIMLRLSKLDLSNEERRLSVMVSAAIHPLIATGFMSIIYVIIHFKVIGLQAGSSEPTGDPQLAFEWIAAFLSGFSEKFAPSILSRVDDTLSGAGSSASSSAAAKS